MMYVIIGVVAAISIFYYLNAMKKVKAASANINMGEERKKYPEYKKEVLTVAMPYIQEWLKDVKIDELTTTTLSQTTVDKVKAMAGRELKKAALGLVGVKTRTIQVDSYAILSGDELHFVNHDKNGELDQHIVFGKDRLSESVISYGGIKKPDGHFGSEDNLPRIYNLNIPIGDDKVIVLELHDRLKVTEVSYNVEKQTQCMVRNTVVGEQLVIKLLEVYPHLKEQLDAENIEKA